MPEERERLEARVEGGLSREFIAELERWNQRRLDAIRITGTTAGRQENEIGPNALRRALRGTD